MVKKTNRRKVIKSVGSGVFLSLGTSSVSGKSNGNKYSGLAYDPVTHKILGEASAQLNGAHDDLRGNLRIGNYRVNMNKATKFDHANKKFTETKYRFNNKSVDKNTNEDSPSSARLTAVDNRLTGYIKDGQNKIAYTLFPQQSRVSQQSGGSILKNVLKDTRLVGGE
ncbi:hypothetical protein ACAH01_15330 [Halomicrobium sp. HM KBTZ05]|uniref:hypothetical protein n=1 Tax=Halomicrobium sp. HM KBTZ05 TaxID=3242663 RepID=UPI0035581B1E